MLTKVAIVILNWNGKADTAECIGSIKKLVLDNVKVEIIVVDNASTDDSRAEIKKILKKITFEKGGFKGVLIKNKENLGFAAGNNVGITYALNSKSDYVMILNNDTFVDENLLTNLIYVMSKHPEAGALSPKIYFAPGFEFHKDRYQNKDLGKVIWYAGGVMDWNNIYGTNYGVDEIDHGQYDEIRETDFVTGACVLFRRETLKKVGMFDPKYFMYLEDVDLSLRIRNCGWKVLYAPPAHIWHKVAQSSGIGSRLNDYFITRNRLLLGMNYASKRTKFALIRESIRIFFYGRLWQKHGVKDYFFRRMGRGSWISE